MLRGRLTVRRCEEALSNFTAVTRGPNYETLPEVAMFTEIWTSGLNWFLRNASTLDGKASTLDDKNIRIEEEIRKTRNALLWLTNMIDDGTDIKPESKKFLIIWVNFLDWLLMESHR